MEDLIGLMEIAMRVIGLTEDWTVEENSLVKTETFTKACLRTIISKMV